MVELVQSKWECLGIVVLTFLSVGDSRVYDHGSENKCLQAFVDKFLDRTGVKWENRDIFEKKPGKYFMAEVDDGNDDPGNSQNFLRILNPKTDDDEVIKTRVKRAKQETKTEDMVILTFILFSFFQEVDKKSLPNRVQDLVHLIFDQKMMIKALENMNIDVNKMPLGKIKKSQIVDGYKVTPMGNTNITFLRS
jgi:hypothetical protein